MIQKRIPKIIYKYRSWQETDRYLDEESKFQKRILINSEIFFSNPKDFNDPFDLRIPKRYDKLTITIYTAPLITLQSAPSNTLQ